MLVLLFYNHKAIKELKEEASIIIEEIGRKAIAPWEIDCQESIYDP
jgi:hypothetical protein